MTRLPRTPAWFHVPHSMHRATMEESGVPLYLPAFAPEGLVADSPVAERTAEAEMGVGADDFFLDTDPDDDFY